MLCRNPYVRGMHAYPCGQCMPCRFNKRREWTHRIMLEASLSGDNAFVTLTYDDEHVPADGSLSPKHVQDWLKRFRAAIAPLRVRFYLVGEYGDDTWRPHYHVALFGFPTCSYAGSRYGARLRRCCPSCDLVLRTWSLGMVKLGTLTVESSQYIAGYVTKKMTAKDDWRLKGRHPEFTRMSLRPGIGADFMHEVASSLLSFNLEQSEADVPSALRHGRRILPLGRYLRRRLRTLVGKEANAPQATLDEAEKELRPVWDAAQAYAPGIRMALYKADLTEASRVKVLQLETRNRIRKQKRTI